MDQEEHDEERTVFLESQGYKVIRFWNNQVMNDMDGVIKAITEVLESKEETHSQPPPFGEHE